MMMTEKYLIMVSINNNNKFYKMIPSADGKTFDAIFGRVGTAGQKVTYKASDFEKKYQEKVNKGYVDQTAIMNVSAEEGVTEARDLKIEDEDVRKLVDFLRNSARQAVRTNYRINANQVTPAMVEKAESLIAQMAASTDRLVFNKLLLALFETIPRKMSNVFSFMAKVDEDMGKILSRESDLLDVMKGQIATETDDKEGEVTVKGQSLKSLGISIEPCTEKELSEIRNHLDSETRPRFKTAYRVCNHKTEAAFEGYCKKKGIEEIKYYYHGSRSENWWSIINTGLKLNPSNVAITGKMFGYGIYFAPLARKSAGYTSVRGAYWTKGTATTGFLAVYKIAYGKPYDVYSFEHSYSNFRENDILKKGCDCLHAHAGASLRNDEVIVYNENAATIKYLIELS